MDKISFAFPCVTNKIVSLILHVNEQAYGDEEGGWSMGIRWCGHIVFVYTLFIYPVILALNLWGEKCRPKHFSLFNLYSHQYTCICWGECKITRLIRDFLQSFPNPSCSCSLLIYHKPPTCGAFVLFLQQIFHVSLYIPHCIFI